jgi:RNA polymerase sigma-70 factor (ECF subfamily)
MRYGPANPALTDDLVQETYLRLCRDNCRVLHSFEARHDEAIFGYLKVIATSVALDHFRGRATLKRRAEVAEGPGQPEASASAAAIEQAALLKQLEQHLAASESERDRSIFWLYYKQGYTAKDIAAIPGLGLSQKGVESCIFRLTRVLRSTVMAKSGGEKGNQGKTALGVIQ